MAKIAGAIDTVVSFLDAIIQAQPALKFPSAAGKEMSIRDLAGLARSVQAATSLRQGARIDESDLKSLEQRLSAIGADAKSLLVQIARPSVAAS